jgi:hypothetical protein
MPHTDAVRTLAALDALQPAQHLLRLGWVAVTGRVRDGDGNVGYCFPLISQPVVLRRNVDSPNLTLCPAGEMELTPLVGDAERGAALEQSPQFGGGALGPEAGEVTARQVTRLPRLQSWIREVVAACGLPPVVDILPPGEDPMGHRARVGLVACVGSLVYAARDLPTPRLDRSLRAWASTRGVGGTAFGAVYGTGQAAPAPLGQESVDTPLPLTPAQRAAAVRPRHEPLTVVSGPPGSGKSHTAAAIAVDAVSRGWSVLVASRTAHGVDVLSGLLDRSPGPVPLQFGQAQSAEVVERAVSGGTTPAGVRAAEQELAEARAHQHMLERAIAGRLERERQAASATRWDTLLPQLGTVAPRAFHPGADPDRLAGLLRRARGTDNDGRWRRWRARWADGRLRATVRASPTTPIAELALAVQAAQDRRVAAELTAAGGTRLAPAYAELATADDEVLAAAGRLAAARAASEHRRRRGRAATDDLGALLRAGRRQRRALLAAADASSLVTAFPLWIGTVADVDDLVPPTAGLFDLVVLDEAGQIDQPAAAGALLRGRRAVVTGDPHQLRPVPHLSGEAVAAAVTDRGLDAQASRLDVGRASVMEVAAGAADVTWLDEHFRSVPQLVELPARRFYESRLLVATRHPAHEAGDTVDVVHVEVDAPDAADQAKLEVAAALDQIEQLAAAGRSDIGLVSPFREVADSLQAAILARHDLDDVDRLGLRVGTVEAFQGSHVDTVVLVLGLAPGDPVERRRHVEDARRFNVMVTRARRHLVVVTSLPAPTVAAPAGLIDAFLAHAHAHAGGPDHPPALRATAPGASPWTTALAGELRSLGVAVATDYPVGRWTVDLVAGSGADAVAVETGVHGDGPPAHVDRQRTLRGGGWRVVDGYASRWDGDAARAAADIARAAGA